MSHSASRLWPVARGVPDEWTFVVGRGCGDGLVRPCRLGYSVCRANQGASHRHKALPEPRLRTLSLARGEFVPPRQLRRGGQKEASNTPDDILGPVDSGIDIVMALSDHVAVVDLLELFAISERNIALDGHAMMRGFD